MNKKVLSFLTALCLGTASFMPLAGAAPAAEGSGVVKKIVYVPIDNRPVNEKQTVAVAEKLGYEVLVPPNELLGQREGYGLPDELWQWLEENARGAQAAVVSSDAMLYGSLVGSRKHTYSQSEVMERVEHFLR